MAHRRAVVTLVCLWLAWLAGVVPVVDVLLPMARPGESSEYLFVAALLAYFAAPFLISAYLD